MRTIALASTFLTAATLTGCSDGTPTAPAERGSHPTFDFTNGPSNPGPIVVRLAGVEIIHIDNDPARGLMTIQTPTFNNPACGGTATFDQFDIQRVVTPNGVNAVGHQVGTNQNTAVYGTADLREAGFAGVFGFGGFDPVVFCGFINGPKKIAEGPANWEQIGAQGGTNVIERRIEGLLTAVGGGTLHLTDRQVVSVQGGVIVPIVEDILLEPVP